MKAGDKIEVDNVIYQAYEDNGALMCYGCEVQNQCDLLDLPYCKSQPVHFVSADTAAIRRLRGEVV